MRIVQSFWSGDKDLTKNSFGWLSPQYHLMGWTLSCLKIKAHYNDLHLYTDTPGKNILIDYLQLPYTSCHTTYDHINHYKSCLYALPKIMTYAAQDEPFIHIDGDVFIFDKFSPALEKADIIAQNLETGTAFNETIVKSLRNDIHFIPDYLADEIDKTTHSAYNAGILGGNDIAFLKRYASKSLEFIDRNCESIYKNNVPSNFNIIFEQILFHALTVREKREVNCYYSKTYNDHGYTIGDFADFTEVPYRLKYLHLIGGHKRNPYLCDLMARTLLKEYPEYFHKILALFKDDHTRFSMKSENTVAPISAMNDPENVKSSKKEYFGYYRTRHIISRENNAQELSAMDPDQLFAHCQSEITKEVFQFEEQLSKIINDWKDISFESLKATELSAFNNLGFFFEPRENRLDRVLQRNEHLRIIEDSFDWTPELKRNIIAGLPDTAIDHYGMAVVPQLMFRGYNEITIDAIDYNILTILNEPTTLESLLNSLEESFAIKEEDNQDDAIYKLAMIKIKYLLMYKCISMN